MGAWQSKNPPLSEDQDVTTPNRSPPHRPLPLPRPAVPTYGRPYVNFTRGGSPFQPLYINSLREPVSRAVSYYYYLRVGPRSKLAKRHTVSVFGNQTLGECVALYRRCGCSGSCTSKEQLRCTGGRCVDLYVTLNEEAQYMVSGTGWAVHGWAVHAAGGMRWPSTRRRSTWWVSTWAVQGGRYGMGGTL